jgi:hypothetical protein
MNTSVRDWKELNIIIDNKCAEYLEDMFSECTSHYLFIKDKHEYNCPSVLCYAQVSQPYRFLAGLGPDFRLFFSILLGLFGKGELLFLALKGMICQKITPPCI